jgi:hypothetical protein
MNGNSASRVNCWQRSASEARSPIHETEPQPPLCRESAAATATRGTGVAQPDDDRNADLLECQRRRENASAGRSKNASPMDAAGDGDARQAGSPELSFPVRSKSLLSRPDLASPWPRRAAQGMGGAEPRAAPRAWRAPDLARSEHRGRLPPVGLRQSLALLALFEAIAVAVQFEDVDVVGQSVEQRARQRKWLKLIIN